MWSKIEIWRTYDFIYTRIVKYGTELIVWKVKIKTIWRLKSFNREILFQDENLQIGNIKRTINIEKFSLLLEQTRKKFYDT